LISPTPEIVRTSLEALSQRPAFVFPEREVPDDFGRAAVLIAFWPEGDQVHTLLTRRAESLSTQPGQVSFPGGRLDPGESWEAGALREAHEEVGLEPSAVRVMGRLDDAWSGTRNLLVPIVAWLDARPSLVANPAEVSALLDPRLSDLLDEANRSQERVVHRGVEYENRVVAWPGSRVIGLSADLLIESLDFIAGAAPACGPRRLEELRTHPISTGNA
jgi:8-oxo-dGTP pyrophosphatase MutT (NUDIX family)